MDGSAFTSRQLVRFSHCDPASIIFFPTYFRLINDLIEDWFNDGLGIPYAEVIGVRRHGLPTVSLETSFPAACPFGSTLELTLRVLRLGSSSFTLSISGTCGTSTVIRSKHTLVVTDLETSKAVPIPSDLRDAMQSFLSPEQKGAMRTPTETPHD